MIPRNSFTKEFARRMRSTQQIVTSTVKSLQPNSPYRRADDVVASLTSFPARINSTWIAVESLLRMDPAPGLVVLTLSKDEFDRNDVPHSLLRRMKKGLDIIWADGNLGAFKKFIPVAREFKQSPVFLADDDLLYEPSALGEVLSASQKHSPLPILTSLRGRRVALQGGKLAPYYEWPLASPETPSKLTWNNSGSGTLVPVHDEFRFLLTDTNTALELTPTCDETWLWAIATFCGLEKYVTGTESYKQIWTRAAVKSPSLVRHHINTGTKDSQIRRVVEKFHIELQ